MEATATPNLEECLGGLVKAVAAQDITAALTSASDALWELKQPTLGADAYALIHARIEAILDVLAQWYMSKDFKHKANLIHVYAASQNNSHVIPRCYLMVVAAQGLLHHMADQIAEVSVATVLHDLLSVVRTCQDPLRGLYLRSFVTRRVKAVAEGLLHPSPPVELPNSWGAAAPESASSTPADDNASSICSAAPLKTIESLDPIHLYDFYLIQLVADVRLLTRLEYRYGKGVVGEEMRQRLTFAADEARDAMFEIVALTSPTDWRTILLPKLLNAFASYRNPTTVLYVYRAIVTKTPTTYLVKSLNLIIPHLLQSPIESATDLVSMFDLLVERVREFDVRSVAEEERAECVSVFEVLKAGILAQIPAVAHNFLSKSPCDVPKVLQVWSQLISAMQPFAALGAKTIDSLQLVVNTIMSQVDPSVLRMYPPDSAVVQKTDSSENVPAIWNQVEIVRLWDSVRQVEAPQKVVVCRSMCEIVRWTLQHHGLLDAEMETLLSLTLPQYFADDPEVLRAYAGAILQGMASSGPNLARLLRTTPPVDQIPQAIRLLEVIVNYLDEEHMKMLAVFAHNVGQCSSMSVSDRVAMLHCLRSVCSCARERGVKLAVSLAAVSHELRLLILSAHKQILAQVSQQRLAAKAVADEEEPDEADGANSEKTEEAKLVDEEEETSAGLRSGLRFKLEALLQILATVCEDLNDLSGLVGFSQTLASAVLVNDLCKHYAHAGLKVKLYELITMAVSVYECCDINTRSEVSSLMKLTFVLYTYIDGVDKHHWNTVVARLCTYATKLLNDTDQVLLITRCALLFNKRPYGEHTRAVECLAKCLRVLQTCTGDRVLMAVAGVRQALDICSEEGNALIDDHLRLELNALATAAPLQAKPPPPRGIRDSFIFA